MKAKYYLLAALLLVAAVAVTACGGSTPPTATAAPPAATATPAAAAEAPAKEAEASPAPTELAVDVTEAAPEATAEVTSEAATVPCATVNQDQWVASGHADASAEAFRHWDEESPAEIPPECARCHSSTGYHDFLGADQSAVGSVDNPVAIGTVIECQACHNLAAQALDSVVFPSGAEITGTGPSSRCMECHQGRASTTTVADAIAKAGLEGNLDTASPDLRFVNVHYFAAAATQHGSLAKGGYEYDGMAYQGKFRHVPAHDSCVECHDPHTLQVKVEECAPFHHGVTSVEDLRNIRMNSSLVDYDGDGNVEEGIAAKIEGLQAMAMTAIQAYATQVSGTAIAYNAAAYPYWFVDTNGDGTADETESVADNGYATFTGHLLQAACNYQVSLKDPGAFAHNAKYIIELLYDSIATLNQAISTPVDLTAANRDDAGHFLGIAEAFRHSDEEASGLVSAGCVRCHTAEGMPIYLRDNSTISLPPSESLKCQTCHTNMQDYAFYEVQQVTFPSGAKLSFEDSPSSNLCITCHQGRESTVSVNAAIAKAGVGDDEVSDQLTFRNVHYFAAGATLFGSEAHGAYEYTDKQYNGRFQHVPMFDTCAECHDAHRLEGCWESCAGCHEGVTRLEDLRQCRMGTAVDYDGDGDTSEGICGEIRSFQAALLAAIQSYATDTIGAPIAYDAGSNPYWFNDVNGNSTIEEEELTADTARYSTWTPRLLRAAYNYQYVVKDPGAFAHNNEYVLQVLYDSLADIGGPEAVSGMTRPEVKPTATGG